MALTKVTGSVIGSNVVGSTQLANSAVLNRHLDPTLTVSADVANTYNTYLTLTANDFGTYSNALANDYNTLLAAYANDLIVRSVARANDYNSYFILLANDYGTYSNALANDLVTWNSAQGNDHATLLSAYSNDVTTLATARGNDHTTYFSALANDYNSYAAITDDASIVFTSNKTFNRDVIIAGNLFILGDSVTANVSNIVTEDNTIVVNWNSSDALAEGAGLQIAGTSNALIANITYATASLSKFRIGAGTLTSADDIARARDYQANDFSTYSNLAANDGAILATARGNDHTTYFLALANDGTTLATARGNDHSTLLSARSNDGTTLATARGNDHTTYFLALANDFNTYTSLNANLNSVQTNVAAKVSKAGDVMTGELTLSGPPTSASNAATKAYVDGALGLSLQPRYNTNVSSGTSNCFFVRVSANSPTSINYVYSSLNGVDQVNGIDFVYNSGNDTIQYTDSSVPSGLRVFIRAFTS